MKTKNIGILAIALLLMAMAAGTAIAPGDRIDIDIKPGSFPNAINLRGNGVIPVAILGSAEFDVSNVDGASLTFGPVSHSPGPAEALRVAIEDVNGDGYDDLVAHFRARETEIVPGSTSAMLAGQMNDGSWFHGTDSIKTVPA